MATVILVRHGRTTANATGLLAGRTPGVQLDDTGREQASVAGRRLAAVPLVGHARRRRHHRV
jgi:broad specificity phosphatase PhoE